MGISITPALLNSFSQELALLEKMAGFVEDVGTAARRMANPIKGVQEGWNEMSNVQDIAKLRASPKGQKEVGRIASSGGSHLLRPSVSLAQARRQGGASGVAEELSRRGWTGMGTSKLKIPFTNRRLIPSGMTKYLPVGTKGLMAGFGLGFGVPAVYQSYKRGPVGPTGEGGFAETGLGELAGNAAFIASGKLGLIPGMAMYMLGSGAGSRAGRVIDRLRSGASLKKALFAPTPTEAQEQLANIAENYNYGNA